MLNTVRVGHGAAKKESFLQKCWQKTPTWSWTLEDFLWITIIKMCCRKQGFCPAVGLILCLLEGFQCPSCSRMLILPSDCRITRSMLVLMQFLCFHSLIHCSKRSFVISDRVRAWALLLPNWAGKVVTPWPQLLSFLLLAAKLNTKPHLTWCPDSAWPWPNRVITTVALSALKFIWSFPRVCGTTRYWQVTKLVHDTV